MFGRPTAEVIAPRADRSAPLVFMLMAGALCVISCSRGGGRGAAAPGAARPVAAAPGASAPAALAENLCDRALLSIADVSGILTEPIVAARPVPGDAQSCEFDTAGFPAIIATVRPGRGRAELSAWVTGKLPLAVESMPGVGESAVWQDALQKLISQRDNVLCEIQIRGEGTDLAGAAANLAPKAGVLCNELFAAY
jgi:hypothetical protein